MGNIIQFFKDSWSEVRKVSWPTTEELIRHTALVTVFIIVFGAITTVIDFGMQKLFFMLPNRSSSVTSTQQVPLNPADIQTTPIQGGTVETTTTPAK